MTWSFLATDFESTGDVTPTLDASYEYSGYAVGDLLLAFGSYKNGDGVVLPSGWTMIAEQLLGTNDTTANTVASGWMAYMIHDGRTGKADFSLVTNISGFSRFAAYRHTDGAVLDAVGSETAPASTTDFALSAGMTTSAASCLIVAVGCSGRSTQVSTYAATDPSGVGSTIDTTTAPTVGQWVRRASNNSTLGSDAALGFADAIKATAGGTGPISATVGTAHRPVMLAAAFRPASAAPERQRSRLILTPW